MYSPTQLFTSARIAGEALYSSQRSGLIFYDGDQRVRHIDLEDLPTWDDSGTVDTDYADGMWPLVDDFEFQFHPSTNTGVDCAGDEIRGLTPDVDGNIYLYWTEGEVRVIHTKQLT